jgi:hypothetical protein
VLAFKERLVTAAHRLLLNVPDSESHLNSNFELLSGLFAVIRTEEYDR